jgi:threonine/homoserine/homoserine lactone efflux protein
MISVQFLLTALIVVIAPGTGVIYTLALGLGQGRRAAIAAAFGCTVGIVPHLLAAILGVAAVLHTSAMLFNVVKFAGVTYLLYLAWQVLKSDGALSIRPNATTDSTWRIARWSTF